jgi:hypothetical protein
MIHQFFLIMIILFSTCISIILINIIIQYIKKICKKKEIIIDDTNIHNTIYHNKNIAEI